MLAWPGLGFQSNYLPPFSCQKICYTFNWTFHRFLAFNIIFFHACKALNSITTDPAMAMAAPGGSEQSALDAAKSVSLETRLMYSLLQIEARRPGWGITIRSNCVHVHFHNFHQYQNIFNYAPTLSRSLLLLLAHSPQSPVLLSLESFVPFYSLFSALLLCKR